MVVVLLRADMDAMTNTSRGCHPGRRAARSAKRAEPGSIYPSSADVTRRVCHEHRGIWIPALAPAALGRDDSRDWIPSETPQAVRIPAEREAQPSATISAVIPGAAQHDAKRRGALQTRDPCTPVVRMQLGGSTANAGGYGSRLSRLRRSAGMTAEYGRWPSVTTL